MTGMVTTFLLALLSQRAFVINERFYNEIYVPATDGFDWRWNSHIAHCVDSNETVELTDWAFDLNAVRRIVQSEYHRPQFRLRSNRGHIGDLWALDEFRPLLHDELGLRTRCTAFSELWHLLFRPSLRVQDALRQLIDDRHDNHRQNQQRISICAHIRTDDRAFGDENAGYLDVQKTSANVIQCVKTIMSRYEHGDDEGRPLNEFDVFVLSDHAKVREFIASQLPGLVHEIPWQPTHSGYLPARLSEAEQRDRTFETHQEWLLLGRCSYILPTLWSGFSRTALFASLMNNRFNGMRVVDAKSCQTMDTCSLSIGHGARI